VTLIDCSIVCISIVKSNKEYVQDQFLRESLTFYEESKKQQRRNKRNRERSRKKRDESNADCLVRVAQLKKKQPISAMIVATGDPVSITCNLWFVSCRN